MSKHDIRIFIREVTILYEKVRHAVGTANNGAIVPEEISAGLARAIKERFDIETADDYFMPAFILKEVQLYPDAGYFLEELGRQESTLSIIFTQGQVFDRGKSGEAYNLGFQNHKIGIAGIPWYLGKHNHEKLQQTKLSLVHGGFHKTEKELLLPILETVKDLGLSLAYFDDLEKNLEEVGIFFGEQQIQTSLYWVNRSGKKIKNEELAVIEIQSFAEVELYSLSQTLVMLDYDGTVGDSAFMRNFLKKKVLECASRLYEGK